MSKKKKKRNKKGSSEVREWIVAILAIYGSFLSTYIIVKDQVKNKPVLYTAVQILGKEEKPSSVSDPNLIKIRVYVSNTGNSPIELESPLNIYILNKKTNNQTNLVAKTISVGENEVSDSRTPLLLKSGDTIAFDTSFYQFNSWFSYHNQYLVHLSSRSTDFISATYDPDYNQAEKNTNTLNLMDGVLKHHFGKLELPRSKAIKFGKIE